MNNGTSIQLARDCDAVQIPAGTSVTLKTGTPVDIMQSLGGTYTVHINGGLFRIDGKDADALGRQKEDPGSEPGSPTEKVTAEALEQAVWGTLKSCYDPEIPVNIVDLGLVYDMHVGNLANGNYQVGVKMTLTAPGCGMGTVIAGDAQQKLLFLPGVEQADVEIVWDPPWHQSMISAEGRRKLGLE
jgi:probable FeS assembly SUF system protein SufT